MEKPKGKTYYIEFPPNRKPIIVDLDPKKRRMVLNTYETRKESNREVIEKQKELIKELDLEIQEKKDELDQCFGFLGLGKRIRIEKKIKKVKDLEVFDIFEISANEIVNRGLSDKYEKVQKELRHRALTEWSG